MSSGESFFVKDDAGEIYEIKSDSQKPEGDGRLLPISVVISGIPMPSAYYGIPFWQMTLCDELGTPIKDASVIA